MCKPLFYDGDGVVVAKGSRIFRLVGSKFEMLFEFPCSIFSRMMDSFSLLFRLRRSGVYSAISHKKVFWFSYGKSLFSYSESNGLKRVLKYEKGNGPLSFASVNNVPGFSDCLLFGDYYGNSEKESINIHRLLSEDDQASWEIVFTFEKGLVNHVHSIIPDVNGRCVWILTGDFGDAAGIWKATNDFSSVIKVVSGSQQYRACVGFPVSNGLLYATDSQMERNAVRLLSCSDDVWTTAKIFAINGSSIYGTELNDYYVFSTATEPDITNKGRFFQLLTNMPGPGIVMNKMDVVVCRKNDFKCTMLYSWDKDVYPFKLFQFGAVMFPSGSSNKNVLYAYTVGGKRDDLSTSVFDLNEIDWNEK